MPLFACSDGKRCGGVQIYLIDDVNDINDINDINE